MRKIKIKNWIKNNVHIFGALTVILISILLAIFVFRGAYSDLIDAIKYAIEYFKYLFTGNVVEPVVPPPTPPINNDIPIVLPALPNILVEKLKIWGLMLITGESYTIFFIQLLQVTTNILMISLFVIPIFLILKILVKELYMRPNTRHGHETLPLRAYKKVSKYTITPITDYIKGTYNYIKEHKLIKALIVIIWLLNLNIISILLPFIPFYIVFCSTFNFSILYDYLRFVCVSLRYALGTSLIVTLPIVLIVIDKMRVKIAVELLNMLERHNEKVLSERDISTFKWGTMGTRKTMTLTDEALSISVMDTMKAEELKNICRKMFPFFKWLLFELDIEKAIKDGILYNWASCKDYITALENDFNDGKSDLYGYEYKKYGMNYYNGIAVNNIFKVLVDYAKLHFLYIFNGSFIISNYAIREDKEMQSLGNAVRWNCDFFDFEKDINTSSYYSKILNFDLLRMGKKIKEDKANDSLEFGIICIAEADKEQMNAVETIADSVESPYANPKNDGITKTEKFIRHRATIMGYCFAHILKDGQRIMSINADTRELSTLEHMTKPSKEKSTLRFFFVEQMLYTAYSRLFDTFDSDFRYYRGDESLLHYFMTWLDSKLYNLYYRRKNRYGYVVISKEMEAGTLDKSATIIKMYQCNAKILSDRYRTDSHSSFFEDKARYSESGMLLYESYDSTTMSDSEFAKQNSYSRLNMSGEKWKQPFIDKANKEKELKKLQLKEEAKEELKRKKDEEKKQQELKGKKNEEKE